MDRQPTPKPAVSDAQLDACIATLDGGFEKKIQSMCFNTGAQALLVYSATHNPFMEGGGKPANIEVLAAQQGTGFSCDKWGSIMFAPMDVDGKVEDFTPTPIRAEFITCKRDQLMKPLGGCEPVYALKFNTNLRVPGEGQLKLWRQIKHTDSSVKRVKGKEQEVIPLRRDDTELCFMIDYMPVRQGTTEHSELLNRVFNVRQEERTQANQEKSWLHAMPAEVVEKVEAAMDEVERLNAAIQNGEPVEFDETQRLRDGNDIYLPARTNPTEDAVQTGITCRRVFNIDSIALLLITESRWSKNI